MHVSNLDDAQPFASVRDVRPGECVLISPGISHKLLNTGDEPLRLLCCCAPPWVPDDTVLTGG